MNDWIDLFCWLINGGRRPVARSTNPNKFNEFICLCFALAIRLAAASCSLPRRFIPPPTDAPSTSFHSVDCRLALLASFYYFCLPSCSIDSFLLLCLLGAAAITHFFHFIPENGMAFFLPTKAKEILKLRNVWFHEFGLLFGLLLWAEPLAASRP